MSVTRPRHVPQANSSSSTLEVPSRTAPRSPLATRAGTWRPSSRWRSRSRCTRRRACALRSRSNTGTDSVPCPRHVPRGGAGPPSPPARHLVGRPRPLRALRWPALLRRGRHVRADRRHGGHGGHRRGGALPRARVVAPRVRGAGSTPRVPEMPRVVAPKVPRGAPPASPPRGSRQHVTRLVARRRTSDCSSRCSPLPTRGPLLIN